VITLDGDELRSGLNADLGFSIEARTENIRRAAELAKLACSQGNVVLAAFITPTAELRGKARAIVTPHPFAEIYLACDYATSAQRDPKGLYAKAAAGTLTQFTGRDSAFEVPKCADLTINTASDSVNDCVAQVLEFIKHRLSA
jgi:adenylyl-sulfate kinase